MKKIIALLLLLITICSVASAEEILFRDIPWETNIIDVLSLLELIDAEGVGKDSGIDAHKLVHILETSIEERIIDFSSFENCGYTCYPVVSSDLIVAGYDVSWLELQFLYGIIDGKVSHEQSETELYSGKYEFRPDDYVAAYEDLLDKLIWLYGEPVVEEAIDNDSYLTKHRHERYAKWDGADNTSVLLYVKYYTDDTNIHRYELSIEYAKTDVSEKVEFIENYFEQEERNKKYNDENTDGL